MIAVNRRMLLASAALLVTQRTAFGALIEKAIPWRPNSADPPPPAPGGGWLFFNYDESAAMEAIVDRLIPPDDTAPGGRDAGCAVFVDRQLAGPYGAAQGQYRSGPFSKGAKQQGDQSALTPRQRYRAALAALDNHCRTLPGGEAFARLSADRQNAVLHDFEDGKIAIPDVDAAIFFEQLVKDVQEGFFCDPIYGGNRDMAGWKMIGFPGVRYDYRDWIGRHNERYPHPPVGIMGRPEWSPKNR